MHDLLSVFKPPKPVNLTSYSHNNQKEDKDHRELAEKLIKTVNRYHRIKLMLQGASDRIVSGMNHRLWNRDKEDILEVLSQAIVLSDRKVEDMIISPQWYGFQEYFKLVLLFRNKLKLSMDQREGIRNALDEMRRTMTVTDFATMTLKPSQSAVIRVHDVL